MTKEQRVVIEKTRDMFAWLSERPTASKLDYLMEIKEEKYPVSFCYCCEYVWNHNGHQVPACCGASRVANKEDLDLCPLKTLWPKGCMDESSPFKRWSSRWMSEKSRPAALKIVNHCDKMLEEE